MPKSKRNKLGKCKYLSIGLSQVNPYLNYTENKCEYVKHLFTFLGQLLLL